MVSRYYRCSQRQNLLFVMLLMCPDHRIIQITFFLVKLCILNSPRISPEFAPGRIGNENVCDRFSGFVPVTGVTVELQ